MMVQSNPKHVRAFIVYFYVNFNVLKQICCALVGVTKDWLSQNAGYNCEKKNSYLAVHSHINLPAEASVICIEA
jgi:hypothetical protein